jgi:hypothetical protein
VIVKFIKEGIHFQWTESGSYLERIIMTIIFTLAPVFIEVEGAWTIKFLHRKKQLTG